MQEKAMMKVVLGALMVLSILSMKELKIFINTLLMMGPTLTAVIVDAFKNKYPKAFEVTKKALQGIVDLISSLKEAINQPDYFKFKMGKRSDQRHGSWREQKGGFWEKFNFNVTFFFLWS